ncbi:MAG: ThiF family adenylyltransferase [Phycisphaerales bacterium]
MNATHLHMPLPDWRALRQHCRRSFAANDAPETGLLAVLGLSNGEPRRFLIAKIFWPEDGDLKVAENQAVVFDAAYLRRAHLYMREHGLAGLAVFHTHPHADRTVDFSRYDDQQEPLLVRNLQEIHPATRVVSVVVGKASTRGRWWDQGSDLPAPMGNLVAIGDLLEFHSLAGDTPPPPPSAAGAFDRGVAVTGTGALARLRAMRVAVVGASGTGSLTCELLARAGCRAITVVDDDVVKTENLNRILHASATDAEQARPKVDVVKVAIESIGLGCQVTALRANIIDDTVLPVLRDVDIVFGCVDKALPRLVLSRFSAQYLLPYIDVGAEIGADAGGIVSIDSRVNLVSPGRPCLMCTGLVTPRRLQHETQSTGERSRVVSQGYSQDLVLEQPAVMDLNMRAASMGVLVLRHLLQPFLLPPLPVTIAESLVTYTTRPIAVAREASSGCRVCVGNVHAGWGDCGPAIGMKAMALASIA